MTCTYIPYELLLLIAVLFIFTRACIPYMLRSIHKFIFAQVGAFNSFNSAIMDGSTIISRLVYQLIFYLLSDLVSHLVSQLVYHLVSQLVSDLVSVNIS